MYLEMLRDMIVWFGVRIGREMMGMCVDRWWRGLREGKGLGMLSSLSEIKLSIRYSMDYRIAR